MHASRATPIRNTNIQAQAHVRTCTRTRMHTRARARTGAETHMHTQAQAQTHRHRHPHAHTRAQAPTRTHTYTHRHTHLHACTHARSHRRGHTLMHKGTHTQGHSRWSRAQPRVLAGPHFSPMAGTHAQAHTGMRRRVRTHTHRGTMPATARVCGRVKLGARTPCVSCASAFAGGGDSSSAGVAVLRLQRSSPWSSSRRSTPHAPASWSHMHLNSVAPICSKGGEVGGCAAEGMWVGLWGEDWRAARLQY